MNAGRGVRPVTRLGAERRLRRGFRELEASDPDLARLMAEVGRPTVQLREPGFPTLLRAIVAQQVSAAAARSIWARVEDSVRPLTAEAFLTLSADEVRALGFSRQKVTYATALAEAIISGRVDPDQVARMPDDEAVEALVQLPGIGRWTAEIYLLFALGRPDVLPVGDLALQVAAGRIKGLEERPKPKAFEALAEPWRPWRGAAALTTRRCLLT